MELDCKRRSEDDNLALVSAKWLYKNILVLYAYRTLDLKVSTWFGNIGVDGGSSPVEAECDKCLLHQS